MDLLAFELRKMSDDSYLTADNDWKRQFQDIIKQLEAKAQAGFYKTEIYTCDMPEQVITRLVGEGLTVQFDDYSCCYKISWENVE